jgi:hypothetical protein
LRLSNKMRGKMRGTLPIYFQNRYRGASPISPISQQIGERLVDANLFDCGSKFKEHVETRVTSNSVCGVLS